MDNYEEHDNNKIRQVRKKQINLYLHQKIEFQALFLKESQPNFSLPMYYPLLVYGIPSAFRNYIWTQLIPNAQNLKPETYQQINQYLLQFNMWMGRRQTHEFQVKKTEQSSCSCDEPNLTEQKNTEKAIANPQMNIENYHLKLQKWLKSIRMDIPRTFPELKTLHIDNAQLNKLANVLSSFVVYKEEIGYIQGLSSIAVLLLQELNTQFRTFVALTNLISTTALYIFYTFDQKRINQFYQNLMLKMKAKLTRVYNFLTDNNLDIKINIVSWIMNLFTRLFKLDSILIIWDILFVNKLSLNILEQLCIAILKAKRKVLLKCEQDTEVLKLLSNIRIEAEEEEVICQYLRQACIREL